jgi:ureidoglycolate hydrolase
MIERMINISNSINLNDVRRIVDTVKQMNEDEQLVLSLNSQDSYEVGNIFSILERHNFEWSTKGGHDGRDYYIIAKKKP